MDTTIDPASLLTKRTNPDHFGNRLRDACQLFRFYSSIILVVVGKEFLLSRFVLLIMIPLRYDWFFTFNKSLLINKNSTKFIK